MSGQFHSLLSKQRTSVKTPSEELKLTRLREILNVGRREMSNLDLLKGLKELHLFLKNCLNQSDILLKDTFTFFQVHLDIKHQLVYLLLL